LKLRLATSSYFLFEKDITSTAPFPCGSEPRLPLGCTSAFAPRARTTASEGRLRLKISASDFYELSLTRRAAIYVRPGLFGFEWVEKIEVVE
jgi:hypothetical protein